MSLARGYAAHSHTDPLVPYEFERRAVGPDDVRAQCLGELHAHVAKAPETDHAHLLPRADLPVA